MNSHQIYFEFKTEYMTKHSYTLEIGMYTGYKYMYNYQNIICVCKFYLQCLTPLFHYHMLKQSISGFKVLQYTRFFDHEMLRNNL